MKKSNWIIMGILLIASIVFLCLYYFLHFDLTHSLDLILSIIWWIVIIGICIGIHLAEERRCKALRTSYLSKDLIFNPETGIVRVQEGANIVDKLEDVLEHIDYSMTTEQRPNEKRITFDYIVHSDKFSIKRGVWQGEVVDIVHNNKSYPFTGKQELELLIGAPVSYAN